MTRRPSKKAVLQAASRTAMKKVALARAVLQDTCCNTCEYDEAEGVLLNHCGKCCREIVTKLWKELMT